MADRRWCEYVGPRETGGPDVRCGKSAQPGTRWCVECGGILASLPEDMRRGADQQAMMRRFNDAAWARVRAALDEITSPEDCRPFEERIRALGASLQDAQVRASYVPGLSAALDEARHVVRTVIEAHRDDIPPRLRALAEACEVPRG